MKDVREHWLDRAVALFDLGRLDDAEEALQEFLREEPDEPVAHAMLAVVLVQLDRARDGVTAAETSIALAPELALAHAARAQALLSLERFKEAEASAIEAVRLDPDDADNHTMLAATYAGRGRWTDALAAVDKALSLDPQSESARGLRAWALAMSPGGGEWEEAAGATLAVGPNSSLAHALVGHAHLARGGERAAVESFREALRLDPEDEVAQAGLAEAMKASHPLFRPLFRFFVWQEKLSTGWKVALVVGPLLAIRALRPAADNPLVIALIATWIAFVALTWLSVPIANVALRVSRVGRAVLPSEQKRSSLAFLASVAACLVALALWLVVSPGFVGTAFTMGLLAFPLGSAHGLGPRLRRIVYGVSLVTALAAFVGGALVASGLESAGAVILIAAFFSSFVLLWVVRLG